MPARRPAHPRRPGPVAKASGGSASSATRKVTAPRVRAATTRQRVAAPRKTKSRGPQARPRGAAVRKPSPWGLSRRAAVLALVAVLAVFVSAPFVRATIRQHEDLVALQREKERLDITLRDLEVQNERWKDPEFVKAQARTKLHFVSPGFQGYVVVNQPGAAPQQPTVSDQAAAHAAGSRGAWFDRLWVSVRRADAIDTGQMGPGIPAPSENLITPRTP